MLRRVAVFFSKVVVIMEAMAPVGPVAVLKVDRTTKVQEGPNGWLFPALFSSFPIPWNFFSSMMNLHGRSRAPPA